MRLHGRSPFRVSLPIYRANLITGTHHFSKRQGRTISSTEKEVVGARKWGWTLLTGSRGKRRGRRLCLHRAGKSGFAPSAATFLNGEWAPTRFAAQRLVAEGRTGS